MGDIKFLPAGDCAICVEFGTEISPETNRRVRNFCAALKAMPVVGVTETVPAFSSVLVYYDPSAVKFEALTGKLKQYLHKQYKADSQPERIFLIPVCYGGEFGEDLHDVAEYTGLSVPEVIRRHSAEDYLIYMLGFLPGFAYLGGLDASLITPRLREPRTGIPAGSVGIGGEQTGIYPLASPGGWRLIGRTPVKPYDPKREPPVLYSPGDAIRFIPIDRQEFLRIEAQIAKDSYRCEVLTGGTYKCQ